MKMNPKQFVPVEEYEQNLQEMVDLLLGRVATSKIILITPPPVDGPKWMEWLAENRTGAWGADPPDRETSNTMLYVGHQHRPFVCPPPPPPPPPHPPPPTPPHPPPPPPPTSPTTTHQIRGRGAASRRAQRGGAGGFMGG